LSKYTFIDALASKLKPVRVTVSLPNTDPNLGLILVRRGVDVAEYVTLPEDY